MSVSDVKATAFRFCDKAFLAAVVLFVAWNIMSFMSPPEEPFGPGGGGGGKAPIEPPAEIPNIAAKAIAPFREDKVAQPTTLAHDPFWPQRVVMLQTVVLRKPPEGVDDPKTIEKAKAIRELTAKLAGPLVPWDPPSWWLAAVFPNYARILAAMPEPCEVKHTVDPETGKQITFEATKFGHAIGFQGNLEDENKVRVAVIVYPGTPPTDVELLGPRDVIVREEQLGHVVVRWVEEPMPRDTTRGSTTKKKVYLRAAYFNVYRKAKGETHERLIARIDGPAANRRTVPVQPGADPMMEEMMPPGEVYDDGRGMPPGLPRRGVPYEPMPGVPPGMTREQMMEGGMPRGGAPPRMLVPEDRGETPRDFQPDRTERKSEYLYIDSTVESEANYTYSVKAVGVDDLGQEYVEYASSEADTAGPGYPILTAQKFTIVYIGNRVRNGIVMAKIIVFIGRREDPLEAREFLVPVGGWIGDAPDVAGAEDEEPAADDEAAKAAAAAGVLAAADVTGEPPAGAGEDEGGQSYVTRHVLVDIVPNARRLLVDDIVTADQAGKPKRIKSYKYVPKPKIIIRDRKNRLHELWHERLRLAPATDRDSRDKRRIRQPGIPPEAFEGMPPEYLEEMRRQPPRGKRPRR